ncbi:MAG: hypothetical protein JOZ48_02195, partial [Acidobacteriaceae bacterium]|nr:hypothetical protein [Acidobacteriaceae bacterium]
MKQPTLRINPGPCPPGSGTVLVSDLEPNVVRGLDSTIMGDLISSIFRVSVVQEEASKDEMLPNVAGRYQVAEDAIEFIPHFPFERGVKYRASFDSRPIHGFESSEVDKLEFSFSAELSAAPTEVTEIFPSGDLLPENLLRFYVCFSNSMQRGQAEKQIALVGPDGRRVADALYRAPIELWDRSMTRLTVLLDPGRLKRWVGPNVALGPPVKVGYEYTLEIGSGMIDSYGRPLRESFRKKFRVEDPVRQHMVVENWQLRSPLMGTREPFVLTFPRPLDWALLFHAIRIESADGTRVHGDVAIDNCERKWSFTPTSPWG